MNEKLQYASMLEIPVSTASVTFSPQKKKRKKKKVDHDSVKKELLSKVNQQMEQEENTANESETLTNDALNITDFALEGDEVEDAKTANVFKKEKKKPFKISIVGVQIAIIGVLVATIFLTNAIYKDSGINVFLREVFSSPKVEQVDDRVYSDFIPVLSLDDGASAVLNEGVITLSGKGSVYASCDGVVTNITKGEDGKYSIEITHSQNFKSILNGLDYAYANLNGNVYHNVPVGYVTTGATMCFTQSDGSVISNYQIIDNSVIWAV